VGLGSDFDGVGDSLPTGLRDVSQYPNLVRELLARGHDRTAIEKILGGNALRIHGLDADDVRRRIAGDAFEQHKAAAPAAYWSRLRP